MKNCETPGLEACRQSLLDTAPDKLHDHGHEAVSVSFIVPALNEEKHIEGCLRSIQRLELPANVRRIEIIVVDNHSTDRTAEVSRTLGARVVKVAPGHPSRARNAGADVATGEWFAFIDADCELARDWLLVCAAHLLNDPRVVAASGTIGAPRHDASWVERAWYELASSPSGVGAKHVRWLPTFNLLIRRAAFVKAGRFNESLATCEDCDLGYKLAVQGNLILDVRTQTVHLGESQSLRELFRREAWRTRGNFRLALSRPFDWLNWLSLLVPPGLVLTMLLSIGGMVAALAMGWPNWPWLAAVLGTFGAMTLLVLRKRGPTNVWSVIKRMIVLLTYLAGRSAGLIWPFRRLKR